MTLQIDSYKARNYGKAFRIARYGKALNRAMSYGESYQECLRDRGSYFKCMKAKPKWKNAT